MVTGDVAVTRRNNNTKVAFKNCHPFTKCKIHLNDDDIIINMYNLIEYSYNYSDSTASLYHFKRQQQTFSNDHRADIIPLTADNSSSCKYKSGLINFDKNANQNFPLAHRLFRNVQIIVPLKYISSFFRSLEMPLINTKLNIQLNYTKNSVISHRFAEPDANQGANSSTFKKIKTELYVPVVTLNTEDNDKLNQLLDTEFKRKVYWNEHKSEIETITQVNNNNYYKRTLLDAVIPGVNRLFLAGFNDNDALAENAANEERINNSARNKVERNGFAKYFLPRVDIKDYNVLIDGRNFYDQNISDHFKKNEELRKVMTGRRKDYTTGSLLDYDYWKRNYKLICCDLSKQKVLDSNPKANQQIKFVYKLDNTRSSWNKSTNIDRIEKRKRNELRIYKRTVKVYKFKI